MKLEASITRSVIVPASPATVLAVLADIPDSTTHFPSLLSLVAEKGGYTWTLAPVKVKGFPVQLVYGCRYTTSGGIVSWVPVSGVGNAEVTGTWTVVSSGSGSRLTLDNHLVLNINLPRLLRPVAQPALKANNTAVIEGYVANLTATFSGSPGGRLRTPLR
jgi:hypothetical protein